MKKQYILSSLLSLVLSVSMILTGLGLTVHANTVNATSDSPGAEESLGEPVPGETELTGTSLGEPENKGPEGESEPKPGEPGTTASLPGEPQGELPQGEEDPELGEIEGAPKRELNGLAAGLIFPAGLEANGGGIGLFAEISDTYYLVTNFEFQFNDTDGSWQTVDTGSSIEVDLNDVNAVKFKYELTKPNGLQIIDGDTYTITLPAIYSGSASNEPITVNGVKVGTYDISGNQLTITFNEEVNQSDDVLMYIELSGKFNTEVFESQEEVVIEVPYSKESSFTATIKPKNQAYEGKDTKTAGNPYILHGDGTKTPTYKNPTHVDWTVLVNDNMDSYDNAKVVDDLSADLEIVEGSFVIYRLVRNYKNETIERVPVANKVPVITTNGFQLDLGSINDAYEITYTTKINRPFGGGEHTINNNAKIILDEKEEEVSDHFTGTWSGDLPTIKKDGELSSNDPHIINWTVKYNYEKKNLGTVTLTDVLSVFGEVNNGKDPGAVIVETIKVYEVDPDIDGNVSDYGQPTDGTFPLALNANGKAYYITFSSSVPVGLKETIVNTISDSLEPKHSDNASVPVNTIPTGGKVGEQLVDEYGKPYIEWTITMNEEKINVGSINVLDVFNSDYITFDTSDATMYELYKDGNKETVSSSTPQAYTHTDGRTGFELLIKDAGPHTYKFVYRTYYTALGMQQPNLANNAEIVFRKISDGTGGTGSDDNIGEPIKVPTVTLTGPKAGIEKSGKYITNEDKDKQYIEWTVVFNKSEILLKNPKITDIFTSGNYDYIVGSIAVSAGGTPFSNYTLTESDSISYKEGEADKTGKGFILQINEDTNKTFTITYRTTVDDLSGQNDENGNPIGNRDHLNKAILEWQGGKEEANATVGKRDPGISKSGEVVINSDGTKTVNWTIDFNTSENIIKNFVLIDTYTPNTVTVSNIKITTGTTDVTGQFKISTETTGGIFTVSKGHLDAVPYQLTYSTTLSAAEEKETIKNTAAITYTGGSDSAEKTISSPTLGVSKQATGLDKTKEKPVISWQINANTDNANKYVNLVNPVLTDTIPVDQNLLANTIQVTRKDGGTVTLAQDALTTTSNSFEIKLPDGPYEYIVTFNTEILEYPSVNEKLDRYTNSTTLSASTYDSVTDSAYQDYFGEEDAGLVGKSGSQNLDTENVDWEVSVNPEGLTIKNPKITDELSNNQSYIKDSLKVSKGTSELTEGTDYVVVFVDATTSKGASFTITFPANVISEEIDISYSTRLNPNLIGSYEVTNKISLLGGTEQRELYTKQGKTTAQQWFYGGGGSGRNVQFKFEKKSPSGKSLAGAKFKLERQPFSGDVETIDANIITADDKIYVSADNLRAGRYILTETEAPAGYQKLANPIYFTVGYAPPESASEYIVTIMDSNWSVAANSNATAEGNVLTIVNNYKSVTAAAFEASKTLAGQKIKANQFEFELVDESNNVVERAKNDSTGKIEFAAQSFNAPRTYNFTIREAKGTQGGMTYGDSVYDVTVEVIEGNAGLEVKSVTYSLSGETVAGDVVFTNTYAPTAIDVTLEAYKVLAGQDLREGQFTFELVDEKGDVIDTRKNDADGKITFKTISYETIYENGEEREGVLTYTETYTIREVKGTQGGIDWDASEYTVEVVITDDGEGHLYAKVIYPEPGITITGGAGNTSDYITIVGTPPVFSNKYAAKDGTINLFARKSLKGQSLREGQFKFELRNDDDVLLETVSNDASGNVVFSALTYKDNDGEGEHRYTIHEVKGSQGGVTYDETIFDVTVTVVDNKNGELIVTPVYMKPSANSPGEAPVVVEVAVFENTYAVRSTSAVIEASKTLTGKDLQADQFEFELIDKATGEVIDTAKNSADGSISFAAIIYSDTGSRTFEYIIREVQGKDGGVSYDSATYEVQVHVTDDRAGNLSATVQYPESTPPVFENFYEASPGDAVIKAKKTLANRKLKDKQFSFELLDENKKVVLTADNKADGGVEFTAISFDEVGEYKYTLREVKGDEPGIIYDESVFEITVRVTDDGEGNLHATVVYPGKGVPEFRNVFSQELLDSLIPDTPKTGEDNPLSLLGILLLTAGLALGAYTWQSYRTRKRRKNSES